jgi:hypothetical protein
MSGAIVALTSLCDSSGMTVIEQARERGHESRGTTAQRPVGLGMRRGDDARWPCYLSEREALSYMADRLTRVAAFAR